MTILEPVQDPVADFEFILSAPEAPADITFTNKSAHSDVFRWNFGDPGSRNNESEGANATHRFNQPGTYRITLEAGNAKTGKSHRVTKEITLIRKYNTWLKKTGKTGTDEITKTLLLTPGGTYIALVNEQNRSSILVTFDKEGNAFNEKRVNASLHDMAARPGNEGYLLAGLIHPNDLILYTADSRLNLGSQRILYNNIMDPGYHFSGLHMAVAENGESALAANLVNDRGETNLWFQKADASGNTIPGRGKTFKFVGYKTAGQVIATRDGGYALTGGYQLNSDTQGEMLLGVVAPEGTGTIYTLKSKQKITGCDIVEMPNNYFTLLSSRESPGNQGFSEISLKLVDRDITPLNCEIDLVGNMRTADLTLFPPRMLTTPEGFILLTHHFNGTDSDITLIWVDKTGTVMERMEQLPRPGDQYGTDLWQEEDGSLVISGAEKTEGDFDAILLKTDPLGKIPGFETLTGQK